MKVKLMQVSTKVADYDLKEENYSQVPYNVFKNLIGNVTKSDDNSEKVIVFKSRDEFIATSSVLPLEFDENKPVYLGNTGQIFCYLKGEAKNEPEKTDVPTDTKKDSAE